MNVEVTNIAISKLRRWKAADAGWFRDLDFQCFPDDKAFLNANNYHWWVVYTEGMKPIGYAGLYVDGTQAHFCRAGILPEYRGMGIQRDLIKARLAWCKRNNVTRVKTYTRIDNTASNTNLAQCGFKSRKAGDYRTWWREV